MTAKALAGIAAALIGVGALVGFIPVTSQGASCGSAFVQDNGASVLDLTEAMRGRSSGARATCTDMRSLIRIPALVFIVGGAAVLVAAGVVNGRRQTARSHD
jgi:hypothetical protein